MSDFSDLSRMIVDYKVYTEGPLLNGAVMAARGAATALKVGGNVLKTGKEVAGGVLNTAKNTVSGVANKAKQVVNHVTGNGNQQNQQNTQNQKPAPTTEDVDDGVITEGFMKDFANKLGEIQERRKAMNTENNAANMQQTTPTAQSNSAQQGADKLKQLQASQKTMNDTSAKFDAAFDRLNQTASNKAKQFA